MPKIIGMIKERGIMPSITRFQYTPVDMDIAMEVVVGIGRERNHKFIIDEENRFTYENLIRWVHCDTDMKCIDPITKNIIPADLKRGIYIAGNTGSGKSWCLEIMAAYAMVFNFQIVAGGTKRALYWKNIRTDSICDSFTEQGTFTKFKEMPIIGIQDLGSEPLMSLHMGNRVNVMRQVLEYRGDRSDVMTLVSSNLPMGHELLDKQYDVRVTSRLSEMCNYLEIKGKDRRKL